MKRLVAGLSMICAIIGFEGCSDNNASKNALVGEWKLTSWSTDVSMDLNNDGVENVNLLKETTCANNELLKFESNGIVASENTFNPTVMISELDGEEEVSYEVEVECAEGVIGFATDYVYNTTNGNVQIGENTAATIGENTLTIVYENAIEIYNTNLSEVVATKDLTKVYTKQ